MAKTAWSWEDYKAAMAECLAHGEAAVAGWLALVEGVDELADQVMARSQSTPPDQVESFIDTTVASLVTRSMRLFITSAFLALSGYGDVAAILLRSLMENGLRAILLKRDPLAASLGQMRLDEKERVERSEGLTLEGFREMLGRDGGQEDIGKYNSYLAMSRESYKLLQNIACQSGYDPKRLTEEYGGPRIADMMRGIDSSDDLRAMYRELSGYTHARASRDPAHAFRIDEELQYSAAPRVSSRGYQRLDLALIVVIGSLKAVAEAQNQPGLAARADELAQKAWRLESE
jgi:hypothetical protein